MLLGLSAFESFIAGSGDVIHSNAVVYVYDTTFIPCHAILPTKALIALLHVAKGEIMREESIS